MQATHRGRDRFAVVLAYTDDGRVLYDAAILGESKHFKFFPKQCNSLAYFNSKYPEKIDGQLG